MQGDVQLPDVLEHFQGDGAVRELVVLCGYDKLVPQIAEFVPKFGQGVLNMFEFANSSEGPPRQIKDVVPVLPLRPGVCLNSYANDENGVSE